MKKYAIGFILSLILTLIAYAFVVTSDNTLPLLITLGVLAVMQLIVQLLFFLHLGEEVKPRYKIASFWFMLTALIILIAGSMWIMANLDQRMLHFTPDEKRLYMSGEYNRGF